MVTPRARATALAFLALSFPRARCHGWASATWSRGPELPESLGEVGCATASGRIYCFGQRRRNNMNPKEFCFDLARNEWGCPVAPRPYGGNHHAAVAMRGKIYIVGGLDSGQHKLQIYDPVANEWHLGPDMPGVADGSVSAIGIGGRLYACGGIGAGRNPANCYRYEPGSSWGSVASMLQGVDHAAVGTDTARMYVFGGRSSGVNRPGPGHAMTQIYDPTSNSWSLGATMPFGRSGNGRSPFVRGKLLLFGGETSGFSAYANANNVFSQVDAYDPVTDSWEHNIATMPEPAHGIYPLYINDAVYIAGGGHRAGHSQSDSLWLWSVGSSTPVISTPPASPTIPPNTEAPTSMSLTFTEHTGCCRTQSGGYGTSVKSPDGAARCRELCMADQSCLAFEVGNRCELHSEPILYGSGQSVCMCYIRRPMDLAPSTDTTVTGTPTTDTPTNVPTNIPSSASPIMLQTTAPTTNTPTNEPTNTPSSASPIMLQTTAPTTNTPTNEPTNTPSSASPIMLQTTAPTANTSTSTPTETIFVVPEVTPPDSSQTPGGVPNNLPTDRVMPACNGVLDPFVCVESFAQVQCNIPVMQVFCPAHCRTCDGSHGYTSHATVVVDTTTRHGSTQSATVTLSDEPTPTPSSSPTQHPSPAPSSTPSTTSPTGAPSGGVQAPQCTRDPGFDYFGNDLWNIITPSVDECAVACINAEPCNFFTYIYNKCFLKTSDAGRWAQSSGVSGQCRGTSASQSAAPTPSLSLSTSSFERHQGCCRTADGGFGTFTVHHASSVNDCQNLCSSAQGCHGFEWSGRGCELHQVMLSHANGASGCACFLAVVP